MLFRDDPAGQVSITQPAHAWVAGQLARAWGNDDFRRPEPWEEVCLAAERHDDGWLAWEAAPARDPATGRPYAFLDLPRNQHLAIWSTAGQTALALGRYPALLVSLHGSGLYERRHGAPEPAQEAAAVATFLDQQHAFQAGLMASLRADPHYAPYATAEAIGRNRRLIGVWDVLSLAICGGRGDPLRIASMPAGDRETSLTLALAGADPMRFTLEPWPFVAESVTLDVEGRRLAGRFTDEETMRTALALAPWVSFRVDLAPVAKS